MPVKVQPLDATRPAEKLLVGTYKQLRANAFQLGCNEAVFKPTYQFEVEEYEKGASQTRRIREEIKTGQR